MKFRLAFLLGLLLTVPVAAQNSLLIDFEIEDQFGNVYRDEQYRKGVFIVIGSDRGGSPFNGQWSQAIQDGLAASSTAPEARIVGLAHMKGVP